MEMSLSELVNSGLSVNYVLSGGPFSERCHRQLGTKSTKAYSLFTFYYTFCSGIVLDSGDTLSQIVPVYEGYGIKHATEAVQIGGRDVTDYLRTLITRGGRSMPTSAEFEIVKKMKEECCFVRSDGENGKENDLSEFQVCSEVPFQLARDVFLTFI